MTSNEIKSGGATGLENLPRRGDVCGPEATRDAIFLFQRRRLLWRSEDSLPDGYHYGDDGYLWRDDDFFEERPWAKEKESEYPEEWSCRSFLEADQNSDDSVVISWETESVWFTRQEGEEYGKNRAYNYPDGWRVYCVNANGDLAKILKAFTDYKRPIEKEKTNV